MSKLCWPQFSIKTLQGTLTRSAYHGIPVIPAMDPVPLFAYGIYWTIIKCIVMSVVWRIQEHPQVCPFDSRLPACVYFAPKTPQPRPKADRTSGAACAAAHAIASGEASEHGRPGAVISGGRTFGRVWASGTGHRRPPPALNDESRLRRRLSRSFCHARQ